MNLFFPKEKEYHESLFIKIRNYCLKKILFTSASLLMNKTLSTLEPPPKNSKKKKKNKTKTKKRKGEQGEEGEEEKMDLDQTIQQLKKDIHKTKKKLHKLEQRIDQLSTTTIS